MGGRSGGEGQGRAAKAYCGVMRGIGSYKSGEILRGRYIPCAPIGAS